jgi:hypothetical protein
MTQSISGLPHPPPQKPPSYMNESVAIGPRSPQTDAPADA